MYVKKLYTLVFVKNPTKILLGLKKRGFGKDKWNSFGGKVEQNETLEMGAVRELNEECGLSVKIENLRKAGRLQFTFENKTELMDVMVYSATEFEGKPVETEEMLPKWFDIDNIPYDHMWLDDRIWFPYLLSDKIFDGKFHYRGFDFIVNYSLEERSVAQHDV